MKVLMLIISSNTHPIYKYHRDVWRSYMKSHPDLDCYFIEYSPMVFAPTQTRDTLIFRGKERYGTIIGKTLDALDYCLSRKSYDYVVRTNLSCVWDFSELLRYLEGQPRTQYYAGQMGTNPESGIVFASGAGIVMSQDVAMKLLVNSRRAMSISVFDDVAIAGALAIAGVQPVSFPRVDFVSLEHYVLHHEQIPAGSIHYRVKNVLYMGDRMEEPVVMNRILREHIYAPKS